MLPSQTPIFPPHTIILFSYLVHGTFLVLPVLVLKSILQPPTLIMSTLAQSNADDEIADADLIDPSVVIEPPPEMKS